MKIHEYHFDVPIGFSRNALILKDVRHYPKTILYTHPSLAKETYDYLAKNGINVFRNYMCNPIAKRIARDEFQQASTGVLISTLHNDNVGFALHGVTLVLFVELNVIRNSGMVTQAIGRARADEVRVFFINCHLKLLPDRASRRSIKLAEVLSRPKPRKRGRKPFVYWKTEDWHVKVGKWTNTFVKWEDAVAWAIHHYKNSSDNNWQYARFQKGSGTKNHDLARDYQSEGFKNLMKLFRTQTHPGLGKTISYDTETSPLSRVKEQV